MGDERRRTKRIDVEANLSIRPITDQDTKEEFIAVHATNVSSGGIAFKTKNVLPLHSFYDMLLEMSGCDICLRNMVQIQSADFMIRHLLCIQRNIRLSITR